MKALNVDDHRSIMINNDQVRTTMSTISTKGFSSILQQERLFVFESSVEQRAQHHNFFPQLTSIAN